MIYYDYATYLALNLSARNKQKHTKGWQLEAELTRQKLYVEDLQVNKKQGWLNWLQQIYAKLFHNKSDSSPTL